MDLTRFTLHLILHRPYIGQSLFQKDLFRPVYQDLTHNYLCVEYVKNQSLQGEMYSFLQIYTDFVQNWPNIISGTAIGEYDRLYIQPYQNSYFPSPTKALTKLIEKCTQLVLRKLLCHS